MKRLSLSILVAVICIIPSLVVAETEPVKHNWALGYNYDSGISIHRFLNENWEVYFGGQPTGYNETSHTVEYDFLPDGSAVLDQDGLLVDHTKGGVVRLGVGHTFLRDGRFWVTTMVGLRYSWSEYDDVDTYQYRDESGVATRGNVGHTTRSYAFIGLRPAFDISSRITFTLEFGLQFYHYSYTSDEWAEDPDGITYWSTSTVRRSSSTDRAELYGYNSINSIKMMFRF